MRLMLDSIDPNVLINHPSDLVAGYVDGRYVWTADGWQLFPDRTHVSIAVFASTNDAVVGDEETSDMTPESLVSWVVMRRNAGIDPTGYTSYNNWAIARDAFALANVPEPWWWIAFYGLTPQIFSHDDRGRPTNRCVAHQYANSPMLGYNADASLVAPYWPGVDVLPIPSDPTIPMEDDMPTGTVVTVTYGGQPHEFDVDNTQQIRHRWRTDVWHEEYLPGSGGLTPGQNITATTTWVPGQLDVLAQRPSDEKPYHAWFSPVGTNNAWTYEILP